MILNSDQPKDMKEQDALSFADSAESMAKIIVSGDYPDGFVIGIEGEWGSGKTTYINFIREYLKNNHSEFKIIEFNPWLHSNQENLIGAYFKILRENAKDIFGDDSDIKKTLGNIISAFAPVGEAIANAISWGLLGKIVNAIMRYFGSELQKKPTLESQYKKIKNYLRDAGKTKECRKPFLVIIDDLDRLDKAEVKTMLKLVKSVGRLPYVTYILAYDRKHVKNATDADMPKYLEKITQLSRPIPKPMQFKLIRMLNKELEKFFENKEDRSDRLDAFAMVTIRPYIKKPRDVVLLANSINSRFADMEGILDHVDFFALECLRTFDIQLWDWIRDNKNIILGEGEYAMMKPSDKKFKQALDKSLPIKLDQLSENQKTTLSLLFPRLYNPLSENIIHQSRNKPTSRGIAIKEVYDFYFTQNLDETQILQRNIDDFIGNSHNKEETTKTLQNWIGKRDVSGFSTIGEFLDLLNASLKNKPDYKPNNELLWALTDICDDINLLENPSTFLSLSVDWQLLYTFRILFEQIGKQETNTFLQKLCTDKKRISAATFLIHYIGHHMGKIQHSEDNDNLVYLIDEADWQPLTKIIAPHLKEAFLTGAVGDFGNVIHAEFLAGYILGNETASIIFEVAYGLSEKYVIKTIKGHLTRITSGSGNTRYAFKKTAYPELFNYEVIAEYAKKIILDTQDQKVKEAIPLFIKGVLTPELLTDDEKGMF